MLQQREITQESRAAIPQKIGLRNGRFRSAGSTHGVDDARSCVSARAAPGQFRLGFEFGFPWGIQNSLPLGDLFRDLWSMNVTESKVLVGWMEQIGEQIADRRAQQNTQQRTDQRAHREVEQEVTNALRRSCCRQTPQTYRSFVPRNTPVHSRGYARGWFCVARPRTMQT